MTPAQQAFTACATHCVSPNIADCFEWMALDQWWDSLNYDTEETRIL